jgi:hypothetical protein
VVALLEVLLMLLGINGDIPAITPMAAGTNIQIAAVNALEIWLIIKVAVVHVSAGAMKMIRGSSCLLRMSKTIRVNRSRGMLRGHFSLSDCELPY